MESEGGEKKGVKAERGDQAGGDHDSRRSRHAGWGCLSHLCHVTPFCFDSSPSLTFPAVQWTVFTWFQVEGGSLANLTCVVRGSPAAGPSRVFWYKDGAVLGLVGHRWSHHRCQGQRQRQRQRRGCAWVGCRHHWSHHRRHHQVLLWPGHERGENSETKYCRFFPSNTKLQLGWPGCCQNYIYKHLTMFPGHLCLSTRTHNS